MSRLGRCYDAEHMFSCNSSGTLIESFFTGRSDGGAHHRHRAQSLSCAHIASAGRHHVSSILMFRMYNFYRDLVAGQSLGITTLPQKML